MRTPGFFDTDTCRAVGGGSGEGELKGLGGDASNCIGEYANSGGDGDDGHSNDGGGGGGAGGDSGSGTSASGTTHGSGGSGSTVTGGDGGEGDIYLVTPGQAGQAPGGGGGGPDIDNNGRWDGAVGIVVITWSEVSETVSYRSPTGGVAYGGFSY